MTAFKAGPYTLQFPQIQEGLSHSLEFNVDILGTAPTGTPPEDVNLRTRDGTGISLDLGANALWGVLRAEFNALTLCSTYALWKRNTDNDERLFVSAGTLDSINGTSGIANTPAGEAIYTFRSGAGGVMKITLLECNVNGNAKLPLASDTYSSVPALRAYVLSGENIIWARDRSWPVAPMNSSYGQNEKVWARRYRA